MDIGELGSLGEFVGAIAVIATLVYVAIQTRHTRTAAELTAQTAIMDSSSSVVMMYSKWREMVVSFEHVGDILVKANSGETLDDKARNMVTHVFHELFVTGSFSYQASRGIGAFHEYSTDVDYIAEVLKIYPCGIRVWEDFREIASDLDADFAAALDSKLATNSVAGIT